VNNSTFYVDASTDFFAILDWMTFSEVSFKQSFSPISTLLRMFLEIFGIEIWTRIFILYTAMYVVNMISNIKSVFKRCCTAMTEKRERNVNPGVWAEFTLRSGVVAGFFRTD